MVKSSDFHSEERGFDSLWDHYESPLGYSYDKYSYQEIIMRSHKDLKNLVSKEKLLSKVETNKEVVKEAKIEEVKENLPKNNIKLPKKM